MKPAVVRARWECSVVSKFPLPHILPKGTQVVSLIEVIGETGEFLGPIRSVGVVSRPPQSNSEPYLVKWNSGETTEISRKDFAVYSKYQNEGLYLTDEERAYDHWAPYVIYRSVVGSTAYGLAREGSDRDVRGVFLPPARLHWSLQGVPDSVEHPDEDELLWELGRFLHLACKASPQVFECIFSPVVEEINHWGEELRALGPTFLSQKIHQTYSGFVNSQKKKIHRHFRSKGTFSGVEGMHMIRVQLSGLAALTEGTLAVEMEGHREELLAIRDGGRSWDEVKARCEDLQVKMDRALETTKLPVRPDFERINEYLLKARQGAMEE